MADNLLVKDANAANVTVRMKDVGAGVECSMSIPTDTSGNAAWGTAGTANANVLTIQGIAAMTPLLASQSGTWNITNVSGTISLPTGAATSALQSTINTTLGTPMQNSGGSVTANAGTNLNTSALALESGGNLATVAGAIIAQEATTSGVKGIEIFGAVTTNAPSYTTLKSDAISLDTSGLLRISIKDTPQNTTAFKVDGSAVTQPISGTVTANQGGTWTVQPGNTANTTAWKVDGSAVTQPVSVATLPALATGSNTIGSVKVTDGTNTVAVKAASTIAAATDPSAVFTLSPNSYGVLTAGTAGSASTQVVTVQGIASMTPVLVSGAAAATGGYSFTNITTDTTTTVKSGAGFLHTICVNTLAATGTATVYDNTAGSGTKIATIGTGTAICLIYDVAFATGLTIVTATAAADITVSYK